MGGPSSPRLCHPFANAPSTLELLHRGAPARGARSEGIVDGGQAVGGPGSSRGSHACARGCDRTRSPRGPRRRRESKPQEDARNAVQPAVEVGGWSLPGWMRPSAPAASGQWVSGRPVTTPLTHGPTAEGSEPARAHSGARGGSPRGSDCREQGREGPGVWSLRGLNSQEKNNEGSPQARADAGRRRPAAMAPVAQAGGPGPQGGRTVVGEAGAGDAEPGAGSHGREGDCQEAQCARGRHAPTPRPWPQLCIGDSAFVFLETRRLWGPPAPQGLVHPGVGEPSLSLPWKIPGLESGGGGPGAWSTRVHSPASPGPLLALGLRSAETTLPGDTSGVPSPRPPLRMPGWVSPRPRSPHALMHSPQHRAGPHRDGQTGKPSDRARVRPGPPVCPALRTERGTWEVSNNMFLGRRRGEG